MVTTGLKCAPEIGPSERISATSAAPVAVEFSSSCKPDVVRRQSLRGDARAHDDGNEERGADELRRSRAGPARDRSRNQQQRGSDSGALAQHSASAPGSTVRNWPSGISTSASTV